MSLFCEADLEFSPEEVEQTVYSFILSWVLAEYCRQHRNAEADANLNSRQYVRADGVLCRGRGDNGHS